MLRPVCGFSWDTCLQPSKCFGRFADFHGTLAFSHQNRLGRFADFHGTLAFSFQNASAGLLIFMGPWPSATEPPGPVCGFSWDTCFQPSKCLGRFADFHKTMACSHQNCLGRFVDFHVTLAFRLQNASAGLRIFMGHLPSAFKMLKPVCRFPWDPGLQPSEPPGPVCRFSWDTCFQLSKCLSRFADFHGTLAFSHRTTWTGLRLFM
jgi:hypothetical protein